jgi:aryl-alcohol dehydrogenase-like predicted oxidoreductase
MDYARLGNSGPKVSRLCLGMMTFGADGERAWALDEDQAEPIVRAAVEGGVTYFDTADSYNHGLSELITGRLLPKYLRREEMVVATKVGLPVGSGSNQQGLSRQHILSSIDGSLRRLNLDYVDLYQVHRWDPTTPIEETMAALDEVVRSGRARYIGASSMCAWQFAKTQAAADRAGGARFASMQNHYNLIYREEEREMIPLCIDQGVGIVPWSPLARGLLTRVRGGHRGEGTRRSQADPYVDHFYRHPSDADVIAAVASVAGDLGVPPARAALAWLWQQKGVTAPVVGASRPGHITDALAAEQLHLDPDSVSRLERPYAPHPLLFHSLHDVAVGRGAQQ